MIEWRDDRELIPCPEGLAELIDKVQGDDLLWCAIDYPPELQSFIRVSIVHVRTWCGRGFVVNLQRYRSNSNKWQSTFISNSEVFYCHQNEEMAYQQAFELASQCSLYFGKSVVTEDQIYIIQPIFSDSPVLAFVKGALVGCLILYLLVMLVGFN